MRSAAELNAKRVSCKSSQIPMHTIPSPPSFHVFYSTTYRRRYKQNFTKKPQVFTTPAARKPNLTKSRPSLTAPQAGARAGGMVATEGGDFRKQVMMIFVLAVIGCGVFTTYTFGLFSHYKSCETSVFLVPGASRRQLRGQLVRELALISIGSCAPLAWGIWQVFRLTLVDTEEMSPTFDPQTYLFAPAFSAFVIVMLFLMLSRLIRRTNIMDVVNEFRKSEPIREVPRRYDPLGTVKGQISEVFFAPSSPARSSSTCSIS